MCNHIDFDIQCMLVLIPAFILAGKVTARLVESNGSIPPGLYD